MSIYSVDGQTVDGQRKKPLRNEDKTLGDWEKITKPGLICVAQLLGLDTECTATELRAEIYKHYQEAKLQGNVNSRVASWIRKTSSLPGRVRQPSEFSEPPAKRTWSLPGGDSAFVSNSRPMNRASVSFLTNNEYIPNHPFDGYIDNMAPLDDNQGDEHMSNAEQNVHQVNDFWNDPGPTAFKSTNAHANVQEFASNINLQDGGFNPNNFSSNVHNVPNNTHEPPSRNEVERMIFAALRVPRPAVVNNPHSRPPSHNPVSHNPTAIGIPAYPVSQSRPVSTIPVNFSQRHPVAPSGAAAGVPVTQPSQTMQTPLQWLSGEPDWTSPQTTQTVHGQPPVWQTGHVQPPAFQMGHVQPPAFQTGSTEKDLPPITEKIRQKIVKGEFVDLNDVYRLLTDNYIDNSGAKTAYVFTLQTDPSSDESQKVEVAPRGNNNAKVLNLSSWLIAWSAYVRIYAYYVPDMLSTLIDYQGIISSLATQYRVTAWLQYDVAFRHKRAMFRQLPWSDEDRFLFNLFLRGKELPVDSPKTDSPKTGGQNGPNGSKGTAKPTQNFNQKCNLYNKNKDGKCPRKGCKFVHSCKKCFGDHPEINCPDKV